MPQMCIRDSKENDDDFEILELIQDRVSKYNKPCIFNLKSGHCTPMITLPFGCCLLYTSGKIILMKYNNN